MKSVLCHVIRDMYKNLGSAGGGCGSGMFPPPAPNTCSELEHGAGTRSLCSCDYEQPGKRGKTAT